VGTISWTWGGKFERKRICEKQLIYLAMTTFDV